MKTYRIIYWKVQFTLIFVSMSGRADDLFALIADSFNVRPVYFCPGAVTHSNHERAINETREHPAILIEVSRFVSTKKRTIKRENPPRRN